jgi:hypothetical protein
MTKMMGSDFPVTLGPVVAKTYRWGHIHIVDGVVVVGLGCYPALMMQVNSMRLLRTVLQKDEFY